MKPREIIVSAALCLAAPLAGAAEFSWDPLKDVESVLPEGVPNEGKIIQARHQVREMAQDALASLYEILPGARRAIERSAGYAVFSTFGAQANVAAMASGQGSMFTGAAAIGPGVYLYQPTETGLSATLTVSGTRFFKDGDLN